MGFLPLASPGINIILSCGIILLEVEMINYNTLKEAYGFTHIEVLETLQQKGKRIVYTLVCDQKKMVLKQFGDPIDEEWLKKNLYAQAYLGDRGLAPKVIKHKSGTYVKDETGYMYLMDYIDGRTLEENHQDMYDSGRLAGKLHKIESFKHEASIDTEVKIDKMKKWFTSQNFKEDYNRILNDLPEFKTLKRCFIHTDITADNVMKTKENQMVFIDMDDAGLGSLFIDAGYPLITQCIRFDDDGVLAFNESIAKAFYSGYFTEKTIEYEEIKHIFDGAVFMQIYYMPCFGREHVPALWQILSYGMDRKTEIIELLEKVYMEVTNENKNL